ncbi:HesA/MoeB/ThiF family protein [Desulfovibrio inopinatus]|uniref:HesA/MoeB/ThiF family protein n=1 Tax=Desulfovibrio inopinatus TaxID=102109 RepID=UPI000400B567|nr:HesA/MoeB/ThiF family protein [Desulfovibrio inopinatus]
MTQRYKRQIELAGFGIDAQSRLARASAMVVGVGAIGSVAAMRLAAAGVGRLVLVDHDQVELSNLHRQTYFTMDDLGVNKAKALARRIHDLNPSVKIDPYAVCADAALATELATDCDVIIDGVDDFAFKLQLGDIASAADVPYVFGGASGYLAVVSTVFPRQTPCLRCHFKREMPPPPHGVLGPLPGVTGSLQACEAIKVVTGVGRPLVKTLQLFNILSGTVECKPFSPWDECPRCNHDVVRGDNNLNQP